MLRPDKFEFVQVIGDGAIGSLVCAGLESVNQKYGRYVRSSTPVREITTYAGNTIVLQSDFGKRTSLGKHDLLLLPIKVYQLEPALNKWKTLLHPETTILLLQNGMGGERIVKNKLPDNPLILATTSHGALKTNTAVKHTGQGATKIGSNNIHQDAWQAKAAIRLAEQCLAPVRWENDIDQALWLKLAVNAVINPLTALNDIRNGELRHAQYQLEIQQICTEVSQVIKSQKINVNAKALIENCLAVAEATANNYSSMHQDVLHRRRTEIDSINGFVVEVAKKKGIDVPINTLLVQKIKALYTMP